jgi:hypothetical protein
MCGESITYRVGSERRLPPGISRLRFAVFTLSAAAGLFLQIGVGPDPGYFARTSTP